MFVMEDVKKKYIHAIEKKLEKAKASYEVARQDTIEAEGRMVTRYDSSKTETAWLADGRLKEVKELEQNIKSLKENTLFANISDTISVDLILNKKYQKTEKYVLSKIGKEKTSDKLIESFIGCTVGDTVIIEEGRQYFEYQVKEIQKGDGDGTVSIGSIVTLSDQYGTIDIYYIVNYIGGMEIEVETKSIFCISKQTPLAKVLIGKKKGDKVVISKETGAEMYIDNIE